VYQPTAPGDIPRTPSAERFRDVTPGSWEPTGAEQTGAQPSGAGPADRAKARSARAAARAAARAVRPQRKPEYAHLDLAHLRHYRQALMTEEQRVSYWRRILQAKLDTVRQRENVRSANQAALRPVLTTERMNKGRLALVSFLPGSDIPPLPDLGRLWEIATPMDDPDQAAALARDLQEAERELSHYRRSLHAKIDAVTAELVARYRENPKACLVALPLPPPPPARKTGRRSRGS
jgi:hypothetical protein